MSVPGRLVVAIKTVRHSDLRNHAGFPSYAHTRGPTLRFCDIVISHIALSSQMLVHVACQNRATRYNFTVVINQAPPEGRRMYNAMLMFDGIYFNGRISV